MIRAWIISATLLFPSMANATYFASCDLHGIVISTPVMAMPEDTKVLGPTFTFRVTQAKPPKTDDRNDADCRTYRRTELEVTLPADTPMPMQGDRLWVNITIFDAGDAPTSQIFKLLP